MKSDLNKSLKYGGYIVEAYLLYFIATSNIDAYASSHTSNKPCIIQIQSFLTSIKEIQIEQSS